MDTLKEPERPLASLSYIERLIRLETWMEFMKVENAKQTKMLEKQDLRLSRMEKILWALLGGLVVVEFALKIIEVLKPH